MQTLQVNSQKNHDKNIFTCLSGTSKFASCGGLPVTFIIEGDFVNLISQGEYRQSWSLYGDLITRCAYMLDSSVCSVGIVPITSKTSKPIWENRENCVGGTYLIPNNLIYLTYIYPLYNRIYKDARHPLISRLFVIHGER